MTVTVVTDSAGGASPDRRPLRHPGRPPCSGGADRYRDGEISLDELVRRFDEPISTAAPSPGEFATVIADARRTGPVVTLTVAAGMSSAYSAKLAAKLVPTTTPEARVVPRTRWWCSRRAPPPAPRGSVVLAAARAAAGAATRTRSWPPPKRVAGQVRLAASVADLERLAPLRAGCPTLPAGSVTRLGVRPLFEFRDGRGAYRSGRRFSADAALDRIVQRCAAGRPRGPPARDRARCAQPGGRRRLAERVQALEPVSFLIKPFSPVMVAHTGRGLAGLAWWWED